MVEAGVRNNLYGEIMDIKNDGLMAQVTMWVGGWGDNAPLITSVMTRDSLEDAGLKKGDTVNALIKAVNVVMLKNE